MRRIVLTALILTLTVSVADARRRHHRPYMREAPVLLLAPGGAEAPIRGARGRAESQVHLIPPDWQLVPPDPNWQGRRYMAPDGNAWLALYSTNAANDAQTRFKAVAFADGENLTYLHGDRDRLTVSGLKGDRIFYRKVMLACDGKVWRHVALEYPAGNKREFDSYVQRVSRGFESIADSGCGENLFSPSQPALTPPSEKPAEPSKPN